MTPEQLRSLTAQGESAPLEFKKSTAEQERACRTLCAFANGQGGQVLFGVTPAGQAVGQTVSDRTLEELAQEFQNTPQVTPQVAALLMRIQGEMTRHAMQAALALADREHFRKAYLLPALELGLVEMSQPDKPQSRSQRYRLTESGRLAQQALNAIEEPR